MEMGGLVITYVIHVLSFLPINTNDAVMICLNVKYASKLCFYCSESPKRLNFIV